MYIAFIVLLVLAGLFFGLKFTQVTENNAPVMAVLFKGLTTVCCIVIAAIAVFRTTDRHFAVLVMFGLFFGFLGDELLALRFVFTERFALCFLSGAMSFLVGHVFYVVALYSIAPKAWIAAIPLLIIALLLEYQNSKKHNLDMGKLFIPLAGYAGFVCFMGVSAVGTAIFNFSIGTLLFGIAGVSFIISDSILSVQCFSGNQTNRKNRAVHITYWLAQFLIALSALFI